MFLNSAASVYAQRCWWLQNIFPLSSDSWKESTRHGDLIMKFVTKTFENAPASRKNTFVFTLLGVCFVIQKQWWLIIWSNVGFSIAWFLIFISKSVCCCNKALCTLFNAWSLLKWMELAHNKNSYCLQVIISYHHHYWARQKNSVQVSQQQASEELEFLASPDNILWNSFDLV